MKLSCALLPQPGVAALARQAEALGYEAVWFPDSPLLYGDVWIALAEAAAATERIGLGTSVLIPSLRNVVVTASAIAHVDALAPGRLRVGFGTGFTGRAMFGKKPLSWATMESYLTQLRGLLRGDAVVVDGEKVRMMHSPGVCGPRPIEVPLLVAANGPKGLQVAERVGDGLICAGVIPEGARDAAMLTFGTVLGEGESLANERVLDAIGPAIAVVWHGSYEAAGAAAVDQLPGGKGWREAIEAFPEDERHLYTHEGHLVTCTERDRANLVPELGATTFTGTAEELRQRAAAYEAQGVSELLYWPLGADPAGELERMAAALHG